MKFTKAISAPSPTSTSARLIDKGISGRGIQSMTYPRIIFSAQLDKAPPSIIEKPIFSRSLRFVNNRAAAIIRHAITESHIVNDG